jgi:endonuclease YncB( thermonuclease family)
MTVSDIEKWLFTYPARLYDRSKWKHAVYDGDTIEVELDKGDRCYKIEKVRIVGVNTPEIRSADRVAANVARNETVSWLKAAGIEGWPLLVTTIKDRHYDSFGRYLANVIRRCDGDSLTDHLLRLGYPPYQG